MICRDLLLSGLRHLANEELEDDSVWRSVADGYVHEGSNGRSHDGRDWCDPWSYFLDKRTEQRG